MADKIKPDSVPFDPGFPDKAEVKATTKDGIFISRQLRRQAEATAKAEADAKKLAEEDALDAAEIAANDLANAGKSNAERAFMQEKAVAQARVDARKKFGLDK